MTIIARINDGRSCVALISAQPEPAPPAMYLGLVQLKIEGGPYIEEWEWHVDKIAGVIRWARECDDFDFMVKTLRAYPDIVSVEVVKV